MDNLLYSKRKKLIEQGNQPELYQYDRLPVEFRRQVVHIWISAISAYESHTPLKFWDPLHRYLIRELGVFLLGKDRHAGSEQQCINFLLEQTTPVDSILDLLELTFRCIDIDIREIQHHLRGVSDCQPADNAIDELNHRFREHSIGYQYNNGQIIRVDSGFIHAKVVIPALCLLSSNDFSGAEQEFLLAHEYYRKQKYKDAITNASKAFESTMKIICDRLGWTYDKQKANANDLIEIVLKNELVPKYLENHLKGLKSLLISNATVRNKESAHGQGADPTHVPEYIAAYALHITASNIVFLVEAYSSHSAI